MKFVWRFLLILSTCVSGTQLHALATGSRSIMRALPKNFGSRTAQPFYCPPQTTAPLLKTLPRTSALESPAITGSQAQAHSGARNFSNKSVTVPTSAFESQLMGNKTIATSLQKLNLTTGNRAYSTDMFKSLPTAAIEAEKDTLISKLGKIISRSPQSSFPYDVCQTLIFALSHRSKDMSRELLMIHAIEQKLQNMQYEGKHLDDTLFAFIAQSDALLRLQNNATLENMTKKGFKAAAYTQEIVQLYYETIALATELNSNTIPLRYLLITDLADEIINNTNKQKVLLGANQVVALWNNLLKTSRTTLWNTVYKLETKQLNKRLSTVSQLFPNPDKVPNSDKHAYVCYTILSELLSSDTKEPNREQQLWDTVAPIYLKNISEQQKSYRALHPIISSLAALRWTFDRPLSVYNKNLLLELQVNANIRMNIPHKLEGYFYRAHDLEKLQTNEKNLLWYYIRIKSIAADAFKTISSTAE
ncbi:MAG: hypothetical protein WCE21_05755 [Candidatus Babeliales bacterium]